MPEIQIKLQKKLCLRKLAQYLTKLKTEIHQTVKREESRNLTSTMFKELFTNGNSEVFGVVELEGDRVKMASQLCLRVDHWRHHNCIPMAPECVLTEHKVRQGQRQPRSLLYPYLHRIPTSMKLQIYLSQNQTNLFTTHK